MINPIDGMIGDAAIAGFLDRANEQPYETDIENPLFAEAYADGWRQAQGLLDGTLKVECHSAGK